MITKLLQQLALLSLLALLLAVLLVPAWIAEAAFTPDNPLSPGATLSAEAVTHADGSLVLEGRRGSVDMSGWRMVLDENNAPRLVPAEAVMSPTWSALGAGFGPAALTHGVNDIAFDGAGNVYAGGNFTSPISYLAKWDGTTWSALGSGVNGSVGGLAFDGAGNLYVGGVFTTAGGVSVNNIARWDGTAWSDVGGGVNDLITALAFDGSGNLYAGGYFTTAGGVSANRIAKWDGTAWSALGSGTNARVTTIVVDGGGNLYAGGQFTQAGGNPANYIAKWDGTAWSALGSGMNWIVEVLAVDGSNNIYAGGPFVTAGGVSANRIAKWDGTTWSALGSGTDDTVEGLAFDGAGNLYVGGRFATAGGVTVNQVAKWDGTAWSALGSGTNARVVALRFDSNGDLYAGGVFTSPGNKIATWNASAAANGIAPVPAASVYWPLDEATINIDLTGVTDLLGVGAKLAYDATRLTYDDPSLVAGAFLDDGSTILYENDDAAGVAAVSVTRTSGSGATGSGTAATVTLTVDDESPPGTATFTLSDLLAVDPLGNPITLTPTDGSFEVGGVWPGDTDNNCTAEAADLLPIGLYFSLTGPARSGGFDITWSAKAFSPWGGASSHADFPKSFVDATGDGEIDQNDVLPIGVNYGQTHDETTGCDDGVPKHAATLSLSLDPQPVGTVFTVGLDLVEQTDGLVGTALKLAVDPTALKINAVTAGDFLDDGDLLNIVRLNAETGLSEAAFTRKGVERATSGSGALAVITVEVIAPMTGASEMTLSEVKLSTAAAGIYEAPDQAVALRTATATASESTDEVPLTFTLHGAYPNPFNPATTVSFDLPQSATVTLVVFDVLGREVSRVAAGDVAAGSRQTLRFEAEGLASGTYLYRLEAQSGGDLSVQMGRFVLLK